MFLCKIKAKHAEILYPARLIGLSDKRFSRVIFDPIAERDAGFVRPRNVEVISFEITIEHNLRAEIGGSNPEFAVGERAMISVVHGFTRNPFIEIIRRLVEIGLCPLNEGLAHLLFEGSHLDVAHRRRNCPLPCSIPTLGHGFEIEHTTLGHEIIEKIPLVLVPIGKELVSEIIDGPVVVVVPVGKGHIGNALESRAIVRIYGVVRSDVEFGRFFVGYDEPSLGLWIYCEVAGNGKEESLEIKIHLDIIDEDVSGSRCHIRIDVIVVVFSISPVDSCLIEYFCESRSNQRLTGSSV